MLLLDTHLAIERCFCVYVGGRHDERIACFLCRRCACKVRLCAVLVELGPRVGELLCSGGFVLNLFCATIHSGAKRGRALSVLNLQACGQKDFYRLGVGAVLDSYNGFRLFGAVLRFTLESLHVQHIAWLNR